MDQATPFCRRHEITRDDVVGSFGMLSAIEQGFVVPVLEVTAFIVFDDFRGILSE